ncbi:MAG: TetR/AcrR family transcriptional regulator [Hyphomonadaceae bacterium]|nr:TetR/AcrR family transcriptional regulator [Hyphomonadaceae bacterium]
MNRAPFAGRDAILAQLYPLFREAGVEGVSIGRIADATGLGRSSLYHYFPGGKTEMASAVLAYARDWLEHEAFAPLRHGSRCERVEGMLGALHALYGGGEQPCLLASLLLGGGPGELRAPLAAVLRDWLVAIALALVQTGVDPTAADAAARRAVASVQGALILARGLQDKEIFEAGLRDVRALLLNA